MNTFVSYELAKLLKEKEFNLKVVNYYNYEKLSLISDKDRKVDGLINYNPINWNFVKQHYTSAPTIAEVVMWLYEKHGIWITVTSISQESWQCHMTKKGDSLGKCYLEDFYNPAEAYEAAILYVLKEYI